MEILSKDLAILQDILAVVLTIVLIQVVILLNDFMKKKKILATYITRKIIHIVAAPIYILCWPLYSGEWFSPYISLIVPGIFALQFILIGFGLMKNEPFVQSMCRSGDPKELLRGTLYYAIFMMVAAMFFWVNLTDIAVSTIISSPVAVVAIMTLAFGDGFADVVGRGANKWKFTIFAEKSIPGTAAMFICSLIFSLLGLMFFGFDIMDFLAVTLVAVLLATVIECASPRETDNLTIPIVVILVFIVYYFLLPNEPTTWNLYHLYLP